MVSLHLAGRRFLVLAAILLLSSCGGPPGPAPQTSDRPEDLESRFVNKVWSVRTSTAVVPGTLYVFLSEGTLVITSPNSRPALGTWTFDSGALTMIEESLPYKVDILELSDDEFRIRSNNPGEPVEMTLVPAGRR